MEIVLPYFLLERKIILMFEYNRLVLEGNILTLEKNSKFSLGLHWLNISTKKLANKCNRPIQAFASFVNS